MPRTRTKFIWPPPNLDMVEPDDLEPGSSEPRSKRPRVSSPRSMDKQALPRETTDPNRNSGGISSHAPLGRSPPRELAAPSLRTMVQYDTLSLPPIEQIRLYQNWRKQGSSHDDFCYGCRQPMSLSLVPCYTCRVSYHDKCIPPGSTYNKHEKWYCPICVKRNWHLDPPTMTPPSSPPLRPQDSQENPRLQDPSSGRLSTLDSPGPGQGGPQALSILAEISRSMSRDSPSRSVTDTTSSTAPAPHHPAASPTHTNRTLPSSRRNNLPNIPSPSSAQKFSLLDSHARKSRFATLSPEVDSALWVLYRELESTASLRQHITDLEAEILKLRQDVSIRDNQLILSQRASQASRVPQSEIDRLKALAVKNESVVREAEELRIKNQGLEFELKRAKEEVASMNETLKEWKGKLINIIGS